MGKPAGGRWSAFTRWHVGQVWTNASTAAGRQGHHTERRTKARVLSRPKWPPSGVNLPQHLHAELARCWDAQAVAARALAVEQPVARDEEAGLRAGSWAGRAGRGDRVGGVGLGGGEERAQEGIRRQGGAEGCSELRVQEAGGVWAGARMGGDRSSGVELERRAGHQ
jgi:hypothetical protein